MKLSIAAVLVFAACTNQATAEEFDPQSEMFIGNLTNNEVFVRFYPEGTLFNGYPKDPVDDTTRYHFQKTIEGTVPRRNSPVDIRHIIGLDGIGISFPNANVGFFKLPFSMVLHQSGIIICF